MKTVCVSTFCEWTSYGSVMQSIGLKEALRELGYESFIVRDFPAPQSQRSWRGNFRSGIRSALKSLLNVPHRAELSTLYERCVKYLREHTDVRYYNSYEVLRKHVPEADYYLTGSDQVWNTGFFSPTFFLDFVPTGKKRISYAASMGRVAVPAEKKERFGELISQLDAISVREHQMVELLREYAQKEIRIHIDPSFFLKADQWRRKARPYPLPKPYILVFAIYWDRTLNAELKKLRKKTGYEIVSLSPNGISAVWANRMICDADAGQFLYLIDNAEAVVSSSFHGVALSLNFNKKVAAVLNPSAPSRIRNMLNVLGSPCVGIADVMDFSPDAYASINANIEEERRRGMEYLKEVLN